MVVILLVMSKGDDRFRYYGDDNDGVILVVVVKVMVKGDSVKVGRTCLFQGWRMVL